ncbi:MAG TPA: hypothetical protein VMG12_36210 [Polyangiaceae bacterium]|nr:hypothetical protein [Polyangiaceae bacterium]
MALWHRRSLAVEVLALVALSGTLACGDDEPARDQTVFWMTLSTALGATCSSFDTFDVPNDGSARGITTGGGGGDRFVDGDGGYVECTVEEGSAAGQYNLVMTLSAGDFGNLTVSGVANGGMATVDVNFTTNTSVNLEQRGCTATVREALAGAIWLQNLSCPGLVDPSSPGITCTGTGGLIAENCAR